MPSSAPRSAAPPTSRPFPGFVPRSAPEGDRRLVWTIAYAVAHDLSAGDRARVVGEAAATVDSWNYVERLLAAHRCEALAYDLLTKPEIRAAGDPPEDTIARLRRRYSSAFVRASLEPPVLARLLAALSAAGVPALVVKGLVVGAWLYPDPILREHLDIDLLVPPSRADALHRTLTDLGYRHAYQPPLYPGEAPATVDYEFPSGGLHVDVSYDPLRLFWTPDSGAPEAFDRWWARRQEIRLGGHPIPTLGPEDQFAHLARHLQYHDYFRANSFLDVLLLLRRHGDDLDWDLIGREARAAGIGAGIYRTLELAATLYDVRAPAAARRALRPGRLVYALHRRIWDDAGAGIRDRPPIAGNPIVPRFLSFTGPHPLAGLVLHLLDRNRRRTITYLVQRVVPPASWLRTTYGDGGPAPYPILLGRHWREVARLRRQVRDQPARAGDGGSA